MRRRKGEASKVALARRLREEIFRDSLDRKSFLQGSLGNRDEFEMDSPAFRDGLLGARRQSSSPGECLCVKSEDWP